MTEMTVGILLLLMLMGSLIALETSNLLSAVVAVGAVGAFASIAFLLIGAPDIAITQMVVEVLSLIILIRATISRDLTTIDEDRDIPGLAATLIVVMAMFVFGLEALRSLPQFGSPAFTATPDAPAHRYLGSGLRETGAANAVAAVILDYRGYDTLGEATVLFTSILGALAILRVSARKKRVRSKK